MWNKRHFLSIVLICLFTLVPFATAQEPVNKFNESGITLPIGIVIKAMEDGYAVTEVEPNSLAARANLRAGDVITAVNDRPVNFMSILILAFKAHTNPAHLTLEVERNGQAKEILLAAAPRLSLPMVQNILENASRQMIRQHQDTWARLRVLEE